MNSKKCPKCGESNPPEAVMCWACYTPLTAAAAQPTAATPKVLSDEKEKLPFAPWQVGVLAVAVVIGLGFGAKTLIGGLSSGSSEANTVTAPDTTDASATKPKETKATAPQVPAVPVITAQPPPTAVVAPPANNGTYTIAARPNPRYSWGTMVIVPTKADISISEAAGLAVYAREKMMRTKKWIILHIYVCADRETGMELRSYQKERKGAPLLRNDLEKLTDVWSRTPVRYEYNRGAEGILLPYREPDNWWNNKTVYTQIRR